MQQGLRRPAWVPLLFVIAAVALFTGLGAWQVERLRWKQQLVSRMETAESLPALGSLPETAQDWAAAEYRGAVLTGEFIGNTSLRYVGHRADGWVLYAPFRLEDSDQVILVNRGWQAAANSNLAPPQGIVTVRGYLRQPKSKRLFSPPNHVDGNLWFTEDLGAMGRALHASLAPMVLDTGDRPRPRNDHLGYAIMWFSLAIVAVGMYWAYQRKERAG
ncbi:MAG: hypothetical protein JO089_08595 [Alphaproteobacteria bacterium]|nr:hypothetical protein [Alphaproteobacteria bacterium]